MQPDYKNWVPKGMILTFGIAAVVLLVCFIVFGAAGLGVGGTWRRIIAIASGLLFLASAVSATWAIHAHRAFSYEGERQLARHIITGIAAHVQLPEGGRGLDIGCGSGALTIACAKNNPDAAMIGLDRWGAEYASFNKKLCEKNAEAEGISNVRFVKGDAVRLDFETESFDAVTSNYVYHNIPSRDRRELLLETLRVLKKGGVFAIHDLMSPARYGDMQKFIEELKARGYAEAKLIDTAKGMFIRPNEARILLLSGSKLLVGRK